MDVFRAFVFVSFLSLTCADTCEDADTKACELMATKVPNMCSDTCLSKLCTRFCGHCPVKCYQCHEINDPANCTNLVACPTKDHYCYTTQTFKDDFTEVYKMGCAMKSVCQQYLGPENKRNIDVNGACCTQDKCNNKLPLVILTEEKPQTQSTSGMEVNTTADPTVCDNIDDMACKQFMTSKPDACSETCFATNICPRQCGQCFNCYTCNDIEKINDCNTTNVCQAGHECFTLETLSFDLKPVYRVGCMEEQLCQRFRANTGNTFGRRDGLSLKGGCCKGDMCNDHIETYQPTTSTPAQTTSRCQLNNIHCPIGFHSLDSVCYMIGHQRMTWKQAQSYCKSHCARLVDFSSRDEMTSIFSLLVSHHNGIYQDTRVWTDAIYSHTSRNWVWQNSLRHVNLRDFRHLTNSHHTGEECGFALVHTSGSGLVFRPTTTEDVDADSCQHHYLPLCEVHIGG